ncbi:MAG: glycosyltransferase family 87 protein [Byssovorax sp.]
MTTAASAPGLGRRAVASLWAAAAMPYLVLALWVPIARALGVFGGVPIPVVVVVSALAGPALVAALPRLAAPLPESLDRWLDPGNRRLAALWAAGGLLAVLAFGRMAIFLGDPAHIECSLIPADSFLVRHSCLTAYVHGAILSKDPAANVYDMAFVERSTDLSAPLPPTAAHFAPFTLDAFGYPPPFLLLSRALLLLTTDFLSQRILFAAASLLLVLFALASAAGTLGGTAERRIWLLTPILLAHPLVLVTLQIGNFHLIAVSLCLLCWVALERQRDGMTGTLLAVATLAKIFPGLLGVVLLVQRRWRAVALTCLAALILCALSVAVLGTAVWHDFLFYHLPRVQSGEALGFMATSRREIAMNLAPFGIPFKLAALGFEGWGWPQARRFGDVYSVLVLGLAALAGRRQGSPRHRLTIWLTLVMLASLRSPYAALFVVSTIVVLLVVMTAEIDSVRSLVAFLAAWALVTIPAPDTNPGVQMAVSLGRAIVIYGLLGWVLLRRERAAPHGS